MSEIITMRELLLPQAVSASLKVATKKEALETLAASASKLLGKDALSVFDVLWERERLGSTGVGQGIAIPHGRVPGLTRVSGYFARMETPVNFDAIDDKPVDLVFLLLAPEAAGADHLQALATVSRLMRDTKLCEQLRGAKDEAAIYRILVETPTAQAA